MKYVKNAFYMNDECHYRSNGVKRKHTNTIWKTESQETKRG